MNMDFFKSTHSADAIKTLNWDANSLKDSWFSHIYWVLGKIVMVASAIITMCFYSPILMGISLIICAFTAFVSVKINKSIKKYPKIISVATYLRGSFNSAKENGLFFLLGQQSSQRTHLKSH